MPELPEVETRVRDLAPELHNHAVIAAQVLWPRTIAAQREGAVRWHDRRPTLCQLSSARQVHAVWHGKRRYA